MIFRMSWDDPKISSGRDSARSSPISEENGGAYLRDTTAMASDGDEIRQNVTVGRKLLERYGDDWWEAQVVRKVDTGIDVAFTKKHRGRTWKAFIKWSELVEDADLPEAEQTYRWLPVCSLARYCC